MTNILRICRPVYDALKRYHLAKSERVERLSFVFGRRVCAGNRTVILVPKQIPMLFADECFEHQSGGHVSLDRAVLTGMLIQFAASDWDVIINVHDHWFSDAGTRFSAIDDEDDINFRRYLHERFQPMLQSHPEVGAARPITLAAVVLDQTTLDARIVSGGFGASFETIHEVHVIGERGRQLVPNSVLAVARPDASLADISARHADFVPQEVQRSLAQVRIALVGCGGLGSILAEGLVRLGVRHLVLIDDDAFDATNLNRWQGGTCVDLGRNKAELLAERVGRFAPNVEVEFITSSLHSPRAHAALRSCDIVLGGLDNDVARFVLNRFSVQYLVPYFDAGVRVQTQEGVDFQSRYFSVLPGTTGCLDCSRSNLFDREAVALALHDPLTGESRRAAGYVDGAPDMAAPSVYALNMRAASVLLIELLNFFAGYRHTATTYYDSWQRDMARRIDELAFADRPADDCPTCSFYHGRGDTEPLPVPGGAPGQVERVLVQARAFAYDTADTPSAADT